MWNCQKASGDMKQNLTGYIVRCNTSQSTITSLQGRVRERLRGSRLINPDTESRTGSQRCVIATCFSVTVTSQWRHSAVTVGQHIDTDVLGPFIYGAHDRYYFLSRRKLLVFAIQSTFKSVFSDLRVFGFLLFVIIFIIICFVRQPVSPVIVYLRNVDIFWTITAGKSRN